MKIVLILLSTIAFSSSAILFPEMEKYKVSSDQTNTHGREKDYISKFNLLESLDNQKDNLKPRNMIKIEDLRIQNVLRINNGNTVATIKPLQKEKINNQEKVEPKKLRKRYNFYAKRIYKIRNNNQEKNESTESNIRNSAIASPARFYKKPKISTEEKQDRKEFIFMKSKNFVVNHSINKRRKRSSNIIDEENLFTTISVLKYTGQDTRLTNDLYFKNINQ